MLVEGGQPVVECVEPARNPVNVLTEIAAKLCVIIAEDSELLKDHFNGLVGSFHLYSVYDFIQSVDDFVGTRKP
jgi:hypothetical protein